MRQIALDTETTGLDPLSGDRIIEIAAVEMIDGLPTGKEYHSLINPLRPISIQAIEVHGITDEMLKDKPLFENVVTEFLEFLGDDYQLVIHNASFDMKFLDFEFDICGTPKISRDKVIDSLEIARRMFPGQHNNLDALCRRFNIPLTTREKHGALIDSKLLAEVYLNLTGGRQQKFSFEEKVEEKVISHNTESFNQVIKVQISDIEKANWEKFIKSFKNPPSIWEIVTK